MILRHVLLALVLGFFCTGRVLAFSFGEKHVAASLVAEHTALVPGKTATVALRLVHDEHWHTYWKNPGEAGLATTIKWTLPAGYAAGPIQWPAPEITDTGGVLTYGYGGDLLLLVDVAVPTDAVLGANVTLRAEVDWLMCKEACIPGAAQLELTLPVAATSVADANWAPRIAAARAAVPAPTDKLAARAYRTARELTIRVEPRDPAVRREGLMVAYFDENGAVEARALQPARAAGGALEFTVTQAESAGAPRELAGLLVAESGWWPGGPKAVSIRIPVQDGRPGRFRCARCRDCSP